MHMQHAMMFVEGLQGTARPWQGHVHMAGAGFAKWCAGPQA